MLKKKTWEENTLEGTNWKEKWIEMETKNRQREENWRIKRMNKKKEKKRERKQSENILKRKISWKRERQKG